MAKKTIKIDNIISQFIEIFNRCNLIDYYYNGNIILGKNKNNNNILIVVENNLFEKLLENKELNLKEIDLVNHDLELNKLLLYSNDLNNDWFDFENPNDIYNGKIINIKVRDDYEYDIPISKDLFPLKLKKNEYNELSYKVFNNPLILAIKKKFSYDIENTSFTIIRLYQIV